MLQFFRIVISTDMLNDNKLQVLLYEETNNNDSTDSNFIHPNKTGKTFLE